MKRMKKSEKEDVIVAVIAVLCSALVLCALLAKATRPTPAGTGEYRLPVFCTSDIHGALVNGLGEPYEYKMSYIADKIHDARRDGELEDPDRIILLDGGDVFQGNAISLLSQGEVMSAVFDAMQYDAVAVGNHEFDWGIDTVIDTDGTMRDYTVEGETRANQIPFLCSNIYRDGEKVAFGGDYLILNKTALSASGEKKDVRVAVIGFVEDYSFSIAHKNFLDLGYTIRTDYDEVNRLARELEESNQCDAVILLAHGGASEIANALGDSTCIDLVLGGHIHKNENGKTDWGLRYLGPSGNAYAYLYDELVFENDGKGGVRIKEGADDKAHYYRTAENEELLLDTEDNTDELDRRVIDITNEYIDRARPFLADEIGYITESVTKDYIEGSANRVSTAANFVCDALIRGAQVDVAFINRSGVRTNLYIPEGTDRRAVTQLDLFSMIPFDDVVYCYDLSCADLLDVIEFSMNGGGGGLLSCVSGIDCFFIDDPEDDGSNEYTRRIAQALVKDGELIWKDGQWVQGWPDRRLRVAVPEFAATAKENSAGDPNPLYGYNNTDRLVSNDRTLRDCAVNGLEIEAAENDGHLIVDTQTHFIYGSST